MDNIESLAARLRIDAARAGEKLGYSDSMVEASRQLKQQAERAERVRTETAKLAHQKILAAMAEPPTGLSRPPKRTTSAVFMRDGDGATVMRDVRRVTSGAEVDPRSAGVSLIGPSTWGDGTPKKLVWVQLAEVGSWSGHSAGPFEMTPATFSEIVQNFERRRLPIPFDFEHASEQDATSGSVPQSGSPAPGWVHRLENRSIGGLWGLVEWLDKARDMIRAGEYAFLSPAIRFGSRDGRTGETVGARLTSVALTNQPFLTGLEGLRAARAA